MAHRGHERQETIMSIIFDQGVAGSRQSVPKEAVMIRKEMDTIDLMLGCSGRCVLSCEALYTSSWGIDGVSWREFYDLAQERAKLPAADRDEGRAVAFMEGA